MSGRVTAAEWVVCCFEGRPVVQSITIPSSFHGTITRKTHTQDGTTIRAIEQKNIPVTF